MIHSRIISYFTCKQHFASIIVLAVVCLLLCVGLYDLPVGVRRNLPGFIAGSSSLRTATDSKRAADFLPSGQQTPAESAKVVVLSSPNSSKTRTRTQNPSTIHVVDTDNKNDAKTTVTKKDSSTKPDYYNHHSQSFLKGLRRMGLEPAELHDFKSPHLITPHIYKDEHGNDNYTVVSKAPGKRRTKIISFHNIRRNKWVRDETIFKQNRDFKRCPYSECFVDTEGKMTGEADLVWFICKGISHTDNLLDKPRPPGQLWGVACWESPVHWRYPADKRWRGVFNLTVGFHHGMDMGTINEIMAWRHTDDLLKDEDYLAAAKRKAKTAAWFVSNCHAPSKRDEYVKEMQKYIDVDIYGRCGNLTCPRSAMDVCEQKLNDTYRFYLSFENSLCQDYATYKFFGVFKSQHQHVVPVVRSGFDYEKNVPKDAYINAKDFASPKDLALYLKALGDDPHRYAQYLKAKDRFVRLSYSFDWCDVCEGLHTGKYPGRVIPDAKQETHKEGVCWTPKDI